SKKSYRRQLSTKRGEQPSKLLRMARKKGIHDKVTAFPIEKEHSRKRRLTDEEYNNCWKIARHGKGVRVSWLGKPAYPIAICSRSRGKKYTYEIASSS